MAKFMNPLENVRIASPCEADWNEMIGDEQKRFCGQCKLNVYNLSGMTKTEAERLLINSEGRLCVRFYRRADGTVLTQNCPIGWQAVKRRASQFATAALSLCAAIFGGLGLTSAFNQKSSDGNSLFAFAKQTLTPQPKQVPLMGAVVYSSPTPTPKATPQTSPEAVMGMPIKLLPPAVTTHKMGRVVTKPRYKN